MKSILGHFELYLLELGIPELPKRSRLVSYLQFWSINIIKTTGKNNGPIKRKIETDWLTEG